MTIEQRLARNTLKLISSFFGNNLKDFKEWEYWDGKNAGKDIAETKKLARKILYGNSNSRNRKKTTKNETIRA